MNCASAHAQAEAEAEAEQQEDLEQWPLVTPWFRSRSCRHVAEDPDAISLHGSLLALQLRYALLELEHLDLSLQGINLSRIA